MRDCRKRCAIKTKLKREHLHKNEKVEKKKYKKVEIREEDVRCIWQRWRNNARRDMRRLKLKS